MSAQINMFCAMLISQVTPTHWSRRIVSACSDETTAHASIVRPLSR